MSNTPLTRREFIRTTGKQALGVGSGLLILSRDAGAVPPSDKIVVGHVGVGGMGNGHVRAFARERDVEVAAICDVDETRRNATLQRLRQIQPNTKAKTYADFRHILDRQDIDAVVCATPDHWHALVAVLAFQAGKDVYGEKPVSHTFVESRAMVDMARRYSRVFQLGTQIHGLENYHRVVEIVRSGVLGKIHTVRAWKTGGSPGLGFPANQAPPKTLDWDRWLGPAPWSPYTPRRCHGTFRYFWDYSGGVFADFWCHIVDLVFWALSPGSPTTIAARGEPPTDGIADTPAWIDADFRFPDLDLLWTSRRPKLPGTVGRSIGAQFVGTNGSLIAEYGSREIFIGDRNMRDVPEVPRTLPRSRGHRRNFLDGVKSRRPPDSHIDYAHVMTTPMHLACISFRLRRPLRWDAGREQFVGDEAADRMLHQPYRAPWRLPM